MTAPTNGASSKKQSSAGAIAKGVRSNPKKARDAPNAISQVAWTNLYQFLGIVVSCIICYYNSTQCALVFDDISAIRDNKDLRPTTPLKNIFNNDFWGTPMRKEQSHKSYRPLTVLTFRFNYWLHELEPYGYHLLNVVLHIVVCLMLRRVCRLLLLHCASPSESREHYDRKEKMFNNCSFLAALLFAVHPVHTEAVTGVVGRAELLSSIFFLAAFLSYASAVLPEPALPLSFPQYADAMTAANAKSQTRWSHLFWRFGGCLLASMLCKEQGITVAGICVAYELFVVQQIRPLELWRYAIKRIFEDKKNPINRRTAIAISPWTPTLLGRLIILVSFTVVLFVGRLLVMGSQLPIFTRFDNPAAVADTPTRQLTFSYLIYVNLWLLIFPAELCCDWTMGTIPLVESFTDLRNIYTVLTFGLLYALVTRACITRNLQQSRVIIMCLAFMVLPFVPASNLFFPVGFVVAERILYMPSMGFCLLVAYGYSELHQRLSRKRRLSKFKTMLNLSLAMLVLSHAVKTYQRNNDWKTEYSLFMSGVHVNPRNAKLFNNVGHALENTGKYEDAMVYFKQAVQKQNDDIGAHMNVGRMYSHLKMYKEAEEAYLKAKSLFPQVKPGESYQARIAPNHLNVFLNLATLISKNHTRLEEADDLYQQAISMRADYVQAYINRGDILMKLNRSKEAQEVYEKALLYDSENADIYYNLGVVFLEQNKNAQALIYFNKAIDLQPDHEQALLNTAILFQEMGSLQAREMARKRLYKVLSKDENNEKAYFNLGMLAMDEKNFDEAEQSFKRAIHLKENFRSALFNLALLLADANRSLDAVPYLHQLIRHYPNHVKGLILLGDIYINQMKDFDAAEACYRKILKFDPKNSQGVHNLCVVFVERNQFAKAKACLTYAHFLAPNEEYILRHLKIVESRMKKIMQLPETSSEKQTAFSEYDPLEFQVPHDKQKFS